MRQAARSRIRQIGSRPNVAAARGLFQLLQEEDEVMKTMDSEDDTFETLMKTKSAQNEDTDNVYDTLVAKSEEDVQDAENFREAGLQ